MKKTTDVYTKSPYGKMSGAKEKMKDKDCYLRRSRPTMTAYIKNTAAARNAIRKSVLLRPRFIRYIFSYINTLPRTASITTPAIAINTNGFK